MIDLMSLEPNKVSKDLASYTNMIFGNPKAGKTTLAYELFKQQGLFLGFEDGTRALSGAMAIPVHSWDTLIRNSTEVNEKGEKIKVQSINKQLKMDGVKEKFKVLIIDTVDLMYDKAVQYICKDKGVEDILDIPYGKGLKMADELFKNQLDEWEAGGYRLFFISHAEDKKLIVKDYQGKETEVSQFVPSANKRAFKIVSKMVDNVFFLYIKKNENGQEERVVFTRETDAFFAGSRFEHLPSVLPLDADEVNKAISEAIDKEEFTTDDRHQSSIVSNVHTEYESFEDVRDKVVEIVQAKFKPSDKMDIVAQAVTLHLGEGASVGGATEEDIDGLDAVYETLVKKAEELKL